MRWCYLGVVPYQRALRLQERLREAIQRGQGPETLLLVQHPPVITLGRSARPEHVLVTESELSRRGVELARVGRGGDVTYHGPGQLVGYPLRVVGRSLRPHVGAIVDCLLGLLHGLGIQAWWQPDRPGIWCEAGKLGAIGVDARGGVAMHGFALNVSTRLSDFQLIVPCGLPAPVASIEALLGAAATPAVDEVARLVGQDLCRRYGSEALEVSVDEVSG